MENTEDIKVVVIENGPLIVHGSMSITNADGTVTAKSPRASFCRCGLSSNQPYCDGAHKKK